MEIRDTHHNKSTGQALAWVFFCAVCVTLALSQWHFTVISGEKTNLYFGILASLAFLAAMLTVRHGRVRAGSIEIAVSLALLGTAIASGLHSSIPMSSSSRAFVLASTGLGGFWCARILLDTASRQKAFVWLCIAILAALIALSLIGQAISGTPVALFSILYTNPHPLAHMLLLLVFAPLALIGSKRILQATIGLILLVLTAVVLFFCATAGAIASAVLLAPVVVAVVVFAVKGARAVGLALVLLALLVAAAAHFVHYSAAENFSHPRYQVYRVESYPFSWHVAKNHPLLGVGLRAPREHLVDDYDPWHPHLTKQEFRRQTAELVTPENTFLALLTGCGFPFTLIYVGALSFLLFRLVRSVERPPPDMYFHPLVLLVAVTGSLLHSFTTDTMLHAQLCWFFHVLVGLIPKPSEQTTEQKTRRLRALAFPTAGTVGAVIVGVIVGTHPALAPDKFEFAPYLERIPIISAFSDADEKNAAKDPPESTASPPPPVLPGVLVIELHNLDVGREKWRMALIVDNSGTMARRTESWPESRLDAARELVKHISEVLPPHSRIAVRAFTDEISLKMGAHEVPLTVSKPIYGWAGAPFDGLVEHVGKLMPVRGQGDLCAAVVSSSKRDFFEGQELVPRIVLFTDGEGGCRSSAASKILERQKTHKIGHVDVIALGMEPPNRETFAELCGETKGTFLDVALPADVKDLPARYASVLQAPKPVTLEISGEGGVKKAVVGEPMKLPPGLYSLWLPRDLPVPQSEKMVDNIQVRAEKVTTLTLSRKDGRLTVESTTR
ncbi:MAG: VWA domain-containing protein [Desulfomonilaceae bacterium]|nr:VWA domain-containing protein [Desulfomonilaceae bacterium]